MTRTAIRQVLSALAAAALLSAYAGDPVSAQCRGGHSSSHCGAMGLMQLSPGTARPLTPEALVTKKAPVAPKSSVGLTSVAFGQQGFFPH